MKPTSTPKSSCFSESIPDWGYCKGLNHLNRLLGVYSTMTITRSPNIVLV